MKVLISVFDNLDFGVDTLYDGLVRLLGVENVLEYPHKKSYHGDNSMVRNRRFYPCLFNYPVIKTDEEKMLMLENNEFDIILVGCNEQYGARRRSNDFYRLLKERSKTIPTFIIDQGDGAGMNDRLLKEVPHLQYFKREYFKGTDYDESVTPLSFSYSPQYIPPPDILDIDRENNVFFAGRRTGRRREYIEFYKERVGILTPIRKPLSVWTQDEYRQKLTMNTIGLNLKGAGNDCIRYYEIPAHGMLLLSQRLDIEIENDFEDGKTAVFFSDLNELKEKLDYCLANEEYTNKIARAGYEWVNKYHTSTVRAQQLLNKINEKI